MDRQCHRNYLKKLNGNNRIGNIWRQMQIAKYGSKNLTKMHQGKAYLIKATEG